VFESRKRHHLFSKAFPARPCEGILKSVRRLGPLWDGVANNLGLTRDGAMNWSIQVEDKPTEEVRTAILAKLADFNREHGYPADLQTVALVLRGPSGEIIGGLWGKTVYDWLFVEYLSVPAELRGRNIGEKLMTCAEDLARQRGCVGAWLTTFSFQARGFYEKLGYETFAELENSPRENVRIFMRKKL